MSKEIKTIEYKSLDDLLVNLIKSGSVVKIDDEYYVKTPTSGSNWDLIQVRKKENGHYTFDTLTCNCQLEYNLKKVAQIKLQSKNIMFSFKEYIEAYRILMTEITSIFK